MRDIYRRALDALTQRGRLYYRVLFGMQRSAQLMLLARRYPQLLPQASAFALTAVLQTSLRHVERLAVSTAISIKYSSQLGLLSIRFSLIMQISVVHFCKVQPVRRGCMSCS